MIRQLIRQLTRGPSKAPKEPGWSTLTQSSGRTRLGRAYICLLMVVLQSMAIFLLVTADSQTEVIEALVMLTLVTVFPLVLINSVPTHWVLVGDQGLRLQLRDQGRYKLPWGKIQEIRIQRTAMKGPIGPFYEAAPPSTLESQDSFLGHMQRDDWTIVVITGQRWIHINARDFDRPDEAGRVLGSHLIKAGMVQCSSST